MIRSGKALANLTVPLFGLDTVSGDIMSVR